MPRREEDDEFKVEIVRRESYDSGRVRYLQPVNGLPQFKTKVARTVAAEFVPFLVTESHFRYDKDCQFSRPGVMYPRRTFYVHNEIGPDGEKHCCAKSTFYKPCPVCDLRTKLSQHPDKESQDRAWSLKPSRRQLYLLIERDMNDWSLGADIQLWDESYHSWGKQLDQYIAGTPKVDLEAYEQYYHPVRGYTVMMQGNKEKTGGGGGEYTKWGVREFKSRREELPRKIFRHGFNLDDMIVETDYAEFKDRFMGAADDRDKAADSGRTTARVEAAPPPRETRTETRPAPAETRQERPQRETPASPPPPPATNGKAATFASRDLVAFNYRGDRVEYPIETVDLENKLARVRVKGKENPLTLDFDELTLVKRDDTFDAKPAAREEAPADKGGAPAKKSRWDDEDDDRSFKKK